MTTSPSNQAIPAEAVEAAVKESMNPLAQALRDRVEVVRKERAVNQPATTTPEVADRRPRITWLSVPELYRLNTAARTVKEAVDGVGLMLVGSSLERQDYRDVDLRYILDDDDFAARFPNVAWLRLTNAALSDWLAKATGLDIDFQFQSMTEASEYPGRRHPVGGAHHFEPWTP